MFEATDGWVGDMCQASNFTHVSGRWQRLVFQKKKVWTMRRRLSWGPICAGSMPHFGLILDPVNSHFREFSSVGTFDRSGSGLGALQCTRSWSQVCKQPFQSPGLQSDQTKPLSPRTFVSPTAE